MIRVKNQIKYLMYGGLTLFALAGAAPAHAVTFGSTYRSVNGVNFSDVGTIAGGTFTSFSTSQLRLNDIAVDTAGMLYGVTDEQLYKIDTITGIPSNALNLLLAGGQVVTGMLGLGFDTSNNLYAIAGCNANIGSVCPGPDGSPGFYQINTSTGIATQFTLTGDPFALTAFSGGGDAGDIVFDPTNNRFLATAGNTNSSLFSITLSGLNAATVTKVGTGTGFDKVSGLAVEGGNLFGYTTGNQQIKIDPLTGIGSSAISLSGIPFGVRTSRVRGAASLPTEVISISTTQVPEPSFAPGLLAVGAFLGGYQWMKHKKLKVE
jgi:hypothetical protein